MAFQQESVTGSSLSGFTSELVNLSTGLTSGVLDSNNNLYILDEKKLYFGSNKDMYLNMNTSKDTFGLFNSAGNTLFSIHTDGSYGLQYSTGELESLKGTMTLRSDGMWVAFTS